MLEISSQAEEAIRGILASEGVPDGATFRISAQQSPEAESSLAVSIVEEAPPEDQVVEDLGGGRLEPDLDILALDDLVLRRRSSRWSSPGRDERRDLAAGRRLRHHGDDDPDGDRALRAAPT